MKLKKEILTKLSSMIGEKKFNQLSKQISNYEQKLKKVLKDVDLKSRNAQKKGKESLTHLKKQIQTTGTLVEKKIKHIIDDELSQLDKKVHSVVGKIKKIARDTQHTKKSTPAKKTTHKTNRTSSHKASNNGKKKDKTASTLKKGTPPPHTPQPSFEPANDNHSN